MEKRFNKKAETYVLNYKNEIVDRLKEISQSNEKINDIIEYIYEYPRLTFEKEDFVKRKRVKNTIPSTNRCSAKRACGEQCTRRKREGSEFCGTHYKSAPHGFMSDKEELSKKNGRPNVIIANTIKGKGISFMEDDNNWHYRSPNRLETIKSFKQLRI